jgi:hypothetical protein
MMIDDARKSQSDDDARKFQFDDDARKSQSDDARKRKPSHHLPRIQIANPTLLSLSGDCPTSGRWYVA